MAAPVCYIINKKIDGYIASRLGWTPDKKNLGMNPRKVASLRGLYDQYAQEKGTEPLLSDNPTQEDLDKAARKLMDFRAQTAQIHKARIASGIKRMNRCYDALRHAYSLHQRKSRINFISSLFSAEVDRLMAGGKSDRQKYVNGFRTVDGEDVGGEYSILEGVFNTILDIRQECFAHFSNPEYYFELAKNQGVLDFIGAPKTVEEYKSYEENRVNEYTKILENWNELVPFVLKDLVKKEGVKLGVKKEYTAVASSDNFGDNDIAAKWDMSESKRDGWMENSDLQSAFGSVGQQVRRILATIPQMQQEPEYETYIDAEGKEQKRFVRMVFLPVLDDLGNQQFMDAVHTHQALQDLLRGVQSSEDMLKKMCKEGAVGVAKIAWMQPIVEVLLISPQARTQFFVDFKRNFQPYSIMYEDKKEGSSWIKNIKTRVLNKAVNILKNRYNMTISRKGTLPTNTKMWGVTPVFNEQTKEVNWERLAELRQLVLKWTHEDIKPQVGVFNDTKTYDASAAKLTDNSKDATITIDGKTQRLTYEMKRQFLMEVFSSLGYDVTVDTVDSILHSRDIYQVREQLEQLFDYDGNTGLLLVLMGDEPSLFKSLSARNVSKEEKKKNLEKLNSKKLSFRSLYKRPSSNGHPVQEHSERLLDIINSHQEGYRVESRVRYNDNTMYSFVSPSYLGDRLETISSYVDANDKEGLKKFLTEEYLQSPFFVDDEYLATNGQSGRILNMWLADIIAACNNQRVPLSESVAAIFDFERDLGTEDKRFEDFTSKDHGLDMFVHFFADEQQKKGYEGKGTRDIRKKLSALYPVFILGDAGVSKYIRAPRISTAVRVDKEGRVVDEADAKKGSDTIQYRFDANAQDRVLDQFWNIYIQEKRRMAIDEAIAHEMYANGKKVEHPKGEFSILTFLNDENYQIPEGKEYDTDVVKSIIRQYLDDAALNGIEHERNGRKILTPSFKQRMENLGILETSETKKGKVYKNISTIATPDNINDKVREFFWNTKLATALQLQIMTIDPSFYHSTKDLQKRYKEIHAPGNVLDVTAVDFDGNLYCPKRTIVKNGVSVEIEAGIETVAYFDDLNVNTEVTNPEFMETIIRLYAEKGKEAEAEEAIKNGIVHPKGTKEEDTERLNTISDLLGKNFEIYKQYRKNSLTDGQGYRTLESYRMVMGMAGKWTKDMDEAYKAIRQIRQRHAVYDSNNQIIDYTELTDDEIKQILDFQLVLQPIKPYMFTHEKYPIRIAKKDSRGNDVIGADGKPVMIDTYHYIPVQHKYAEALIIPELMPKGSKLRDLGLWMDSHNVDLVGSTKIAKVGCFGQAKLEGTTNQKSLEDAMSQAYIHELPYRDYRIQTNVPEHINSSQLFGTQVRKLIMAAINMDEDYTKYVGRGRINLSTSTDENDPNRSAPVTGRNLLALYNSLICANIMDSYDTFAQNANDVELLSELLQQSTVGSMRESMDNLLSYVVTGSEKALQKFMIPLFEGGLEHDTAALILSTFKKIVNKQQISGGSAVQVSAFGIEGYEEDGDLRFVTDSEDSKNILYAEIEMPFDKSFVIDSKDAKGNVTKQKVSLSYDKYCFRNGYMIPTGEALKKGTSEWKKYQSYTYKKVDGKLVPCKYNDPEAQVYKPLIEEDYPDILSILAYRIPTERDYSMLNCQIKRFTAKTAGGTLKVPPEGTTIAGFDFDIDKLYFMQREFHKHYKDGIYTENNFSDSDKYFIWGRFFEENAEIKEELEKAREQAESEDPTLIETVPVIRNGVDTGRRRVRHKTTLNSYWKAANIEENFGINKAAAFAETAQAEGIQPTQNIKQGEAVEWMETYDFDKSPEENTRAARNNLLITLIQERLKDPQTAKQRYTPGGFANASKAARLMRELFHGDLSGIVNNGTVDLKALEERQNPDTDPEPNYDPTDPYTMLVYNQQNQLASKLIGIFANQNTNHAFASAMDVFELKEPIAFCGKSLKDLLHKNSEDAAAIDLNMAEFLAASVDAVKDPVLNFLNLNTLTADAGAVLARLGYNTKEIGLLFNQPIIRSVCEDALNKGINIKTAINNATSKLLNSSTGVNLNGKISITENDLAMAIVSERELLEQGKTTDDFLKDNVRMQYAVLNLFSDIIKVSQDVSNFVLNTKFTASNAVSSTLGGMYAQQMKVDNYVSKFPKSAKEEGSLSYTMKIAGTNAGAGLFSMPIDNDEKYLTMTKKQYLHEVRFNPFAYEQAMYDTNRKAIKLLAKYFPYETPLYKRIRDRIGGLARYGTLSEEDINDIHSNIPVALLAKQEKSLFNGEALHGETNITNREYYREKFAEHLSDMVAQDPELESLAIFKYLYPVSQEVVKGKDANGLDITEEVWTLQMQDVGGMDSDIKEEIRESWAYLMEVDDEGDFKNDDYAELGRDLFMYCFYQLGFDFSPLSFMHLAPTAVKDNIEVKRGYNLPLTPYTGKIKPPTDKEPSDDVLVWSPTVFGAKENAMYNFGGNPTVIGELSGQSYQMPENLIGNPNAIRALIHEAYSHPELRFKIDKDLSPEEFRMFTYDVCGYDIPTNILFSEGTLNNSENADIKPDISYGQNRTYRQFLYDILEGKEDSLNEDEFAQMWILNHPDNSRFVFDINKSSDRLREIIHENISRSGNTQREGTGYRPYITIDISKYQNEKDKEALGSLVSSEEGTNTWVPCIVINGSYYMAKSGTDLGFNVNRSLVMTYEKVEPWGCSKTTEYDINKKLAPQMRYQTSLYTQKETKKDNVEVSPEQPLNPSQPMRSNDLTDSLNGNGVDPAMTRQEMEDYIFDEYVKAIEFKNGEMPAEDKQGLRDVVSKSSDSELIEAVQEMRQACRQNGVMVLDAEGNPVKAC